MNKKFYYIIYIGILMLLLAGCQDEGMFTPETDVDEPVYVTYRVNMGDETLSRAIGDAQKVNELKVGVFQYNQLLEINQLLKIFTFEKNENEEAFTNVTLPLLKQGTYDLVFWAQKKNNGIYSIDENFNITIDYANYQGISLAGTEDFEAFTVVKKGVTVANFVANPDDATITLTRPFAQLNIAASEGDIFDKVNNVSFTIDKVYTKFNPLTGVSSEEVTGQEFSYLFYPQDIAAKQAITIDGTNYYYLASAYLLAPKKVNLTGGLYNGTELIKELNVTELPLKANTRTNIYGDMIQQEELKPWDGITFTAPELKDNQYIIDEESDIAWLSVPSNVASLSASTFIVTKDVLNMGDKEISSIQLPSGSTFDGKGKTIKCFANSLFGNATNITVQNLTLDYVTATSSDSHVGVLVNTLTGSSTFTGISITNSSATTTNGAAGGMIGYITNKEGETLQVTISACTTTGNAVDGSLASGIYVGRFRGYDNSETLTFSSDNKASSAITTTGKSSYYVSDNVAAWLSENDYSKYSGFLGDEEFYRGTVNYGDARFVPKWDGTTDITPLTEGSTILINSAFDLASLQKQSPSAVTFMENVDLGSCVFNPIKSITNLDGQNKTIYNLKVDMVHDGVGAAFIQSVPTGKVDVSHKNLTISGADIKNVHNTTLYPAYAVTNDGGAGNAYGGIFISKANECTSYTIENIHVKDSKLYAVCKMGGVIGQSRDTKLNMSNCTVDNCIIQNYKPNVPNYYVLGNDTQPYMTKSSYYINLLQWWYTNGEVGGLIGFLQDYDADIDNCSVTNTQINCTGEPNKDVVANVYSSRQFNSENLWETGKRITAKGKTTIAGRHVNQFIGDVVSYRTEGGSNYTTNITNYTVSGNNYNGILAESTNDNNHKFNNDQYCEVVGCAYYIGLDLKVTVINLGHMKYYAGEVTFSSKNGTQQGSFTEASGDGENIAWIGGNFSLIFALSPKSEYPSEPTRKDPEY